MLCCLCFGQGSKIGEMVFACCCGRGLGSRGVTSTFGSRENDIYTNENTTNPTRYLSSQYLGAIDAQEGSFNVS